MIFTLLVLGIQELLRQGTWQVTKKNKSIIDRFTLLHLLHQAITEAQEAHNWREIENECSVVSEEELGFKDWFRAGAKPSCSASSSLGMTGVGLQCPWGKLCL